MYWACPEKPYGTSANGRSLLSPRRGGGGRRVSYSAGSCPPSHSFTVRSQEALAKRNPSGENAIPRTAPEWLLSVRKLRPVAMSQNRIVLSSPALTSTFPSGETANDRNPAAMRPQDANFVHGRHFKKRIVLSRLPVIKIFASGVNTIAPIQNSMGFWNPPSSSMKNPRVSVESSAVSSQ